MYDPNLHYIDAKGFARDKKTNHLLGIEEAPPERHPEEGSEFPKWVSPHPNHVHRLGERVSTPAFDAFHVDRQDNVTVLVKDAAEEKLALADPHAPPKPAAPAPAPAAPSRR